MHFSKNIKIMLGLATGLYLIAPIVSIGLYFVWIFLSIPIFEDIENGYTTVFPFFQVLLPFFVFFAGIMLTNLLHFVILPVYIALIIKNKKGLDILRIIIAVGCFFLPFIALPAYYLIYILPEETPEWAMEPNLIAPNSAPVTNK